MNSLKELAISVAALKRRCTCKPAISLLSQELSPISWKYGRPASANTSEAPFRRRDYLSNALLLLFLAFGPLVREVQNWPTVLRYYLCRYRDPAVAIRHTLKRIIGSQEDKIDFLKVDCEGCEDDLLLHCPRRGTRQGEIYRSRNP